MFLRHFITHALVLGALPFAFAEPGLHNERYTIAPAADNALTLTVPGMAPQRLTGEFTVLWSDTDPHCVRNASHPNYPVAPRNAVRWSNPAESLESLNAWIGSPEFKAVTGMSGEVKGEGKTRAWEFRDAQGKVKVRVTGAPALDTTRPFTVGHRVVMKPVRVSIDGCVRWEYEAANEFSLTAEASLPEGAGDPAVSFTLTPKRAAFFSVAFTGAPDAPLAESLAVPQECAARGNKQFGFVMSEADLHLPRAQTATAAGNFALVADASECRFRLPTIADSRFGFMLASEAGRLKPVLLAPLLGGAESKMNVGEPWRFTFRCVLRAGDWKETYAHIARELHGFRDQRDNSGPGSLNATLERVMDFLADRRGGNHAMWDPQQKYFDYFNDKTGVFKPFSPLYGLSAGIVTDDEAFFRTRARPAVEYALSRKTSVFAPYDNADNKQANSAGREVGAPYVSHEQLVTLDELFQGRSPVLRALAEEKADKSPRQASPQTEEGFFDLIDRASSTHDARDIAAAREAAYYNAAKLNLYPAPPDAMVTVDRDGQAPVHLHSFARHRNQWGFPPPQPLHVPEQTVPAWRIARVGLPGIAYPIEYWMNTHGAMMRAAGLAHDDFLRDIARWGMVGRFGNFPGDNRSQDSLVPELPDAVERRPWEWNFATVNAGHAWDFAGAVVDFIVSDAFERSRGAIDFPALSAAGSNFRVRIYGAKPGRFYGDEGVHLWLPRGLVKSDNKQLDWLAGHGNGHLYLALWNQSSLEQTAHIVLDPALVECDAQREARVWRDNVPGPRLRVAGDQLTVTVSPKGIVALAIPGATKLRLQAKLYDGASPVLDTASFTHVDAPFGSVHAMLLRAGRGLTSAFVYTEALPEPVIGARLIWRQGAGEWQSLTDLIYPYEFSPELRDDGGDFTCVLEIEDAQQKRLRSPVLTLPLSAAASPDATVPPEFGPIAASTKPVLVTTTDAPLSDEFVSYLQKAANGNNFGLRADGRYYPYSTPQGRRIGFRQALWDKALYATGCTAEEAHEHLRASLNQTLAELKKALTRQTPIDFARLETRQQECLLDFANSEGAAALPEAFLAAVLANDWPKIARDHSYVRYAGHAPDHPRNKAFAERWVYPRGN
jgi:hypothetical protein